jgi:hypothetical protein
MKRLFVLAFVLTGIISCTKEDGNTTSSSTTGTANSLLAYVDSAQIFTTDLTGGNRKLAVAAETATVNEYLGTVQFSADGTKFIYSHNLSGSANVRTIKSCNLDGSNKKILKTFDATTNNNFLKVLANGKILFGTTTFTGGVIATKVYTINEDGTGETAFTQSGFGVSNSSYTHVSKTGQDLLLLATSTPAQGTNFSGRIISYLGWSSTGTLTGERVIENSSDAFNDAAKAGNVAISNDGSLVAFAVLNSATKFDIYTKETKAGAAARKLVYSITVPSDIANVSSSSLKLRWLNGTDKLLAYIGKFTSPRGAATDYTQCYVITIGATASTDVNWKFTGDDIFDIAPNF